MSYYVDLIEGDLTMSNENQKSNVPSVKAQIDKIIDAPDSKTKAYASVIIGGAFAVHSIRIIESNKGLFVSMPSRSYKDKDGNIQYTDYAHSVSKEAHNVLNEAVMKAYNAAIAQNENNDVEDIEPMM